MKLFDYADSYLKKCTWKDLALLKFCLCAVGIIIGICLPKKKKMPLLVGAAAVFTATYIPLMTKFISFCVKKHREDAEIDDYETEDDFSMDDYVL